MRWIIAGLTVVIIIVAIAMVLLQQQVSSAATQAKLSAACVEITGDPRSTCDAFAGAIVLTPDTKAMQCAYDFDNADAIFQCMGIGIKQK